MIEDKIALALKDINKLKLALKDVKKDLKGEEKIDSEEYVDLKKAYKDLKEQVKGFEEKWTQELLQDEQYKQLAEMKMKKEEDVALANQKLFELIAQLPAKPFEMKLEMEEGTVRIQIQPEMRVYLNGREEKRRV